MKDLNSTKSLVLILFIFCAIGAFVLAGLNEITAPIIAQNEIDKINEALKEIAPKGTDFPLYDFDREANADILEVYTIKEGSDNGGYCVSVAPNGFGGPINMIVGIDSDGAVLGVSIVGMSETPGLGTKTQDEKWISQFEGAVYPINLVKNAATAESDIVAISGATISSKAVKTGVETALQFVGGLENE